MDKYDKVYILRRIAEMADILEEFQELIENTDDSEHETTED